MIEQSKIDEKASEIHNWLQDAVGDYAGNIFGFNMNQNPKPDFYGDPKAEAWFKEMKRNAAHWSGPCDYCGAYADYLYDDVGTLCDLAGDRICDACSELGVSYSKLDLYKETFNRIAQAIADRGHNGLKEACEKMMYPRGGQDG